MKTMVLILVLFFSGCSSAMIVKDCKHIGSNVYECKKL